MTKRMGSGHRAALNRVKGFKGYGTETERKSKITRYFPSDRKDDTERMRGRGMKKCYETVWEIFNECANNQMRDIFIDEIETDDTDAYDPEQGEGSGH